MLLIKNSLKITISFLFISFITLKSTAQEFKFDTEVIDYGKINSGTNGERIFTFTNVGTKPLIINKIQSTCGCTIPKKPEKPIMPGEKGEIVVAYDTKIVGGFSKSIFLLSNAKEPRKLLRIKGIVNDGISLEKEKNMLQN